MRQSALRTAQCGLLIYFVLFMLAPFGVGKMGKQLS